MFNNHTIANCQQSLTVKEYWKSINSWQKYGQTQNGTFLRPNISTCQVTSFCDLKKPYSTVAAILSIASIMSEEIV